MRHTTSRWWIATLLTTLCVQGQARADDLEEARALFMAGQAAASAQRWSDAVDNFARAFKLSRVPAALFNLSMALRALGRHREARDGFKRLLVEFPDIEEEMAVEAGSLFEEEQRRVARVELTLLESGVIHSIQLDGKEETDPGTRPLVLEVDPGPRALRIERPGYQAFSWSGTLGDGATERVGVVLVQNPVKEDSSAWTHPALWIVLGVVVAAGAGVGVYFLDRDAQLDPESDRTVDLR